MGSVMTQRILCHWASEHYRIRFCPTNYSAVAAAVPVAVIFPKADTSILLCLSTRGVPENKRRAAAAAAAQPGNWGSRRSAREQKLHYLDDYIPS